MEVVLLFSKPLGAYDKTVPRYLANKYKGVRCFVYDDNRADKSYIPAIRPYLWWQYLRNYPEREDETYFYIDSDVIFKEWPNLDGLLTSKDQIAGSNCDNYIGYEYLKQVEKGPEIIGRMAQYCNITPHQMIGVPGIGAQMVIGHPTAEMWQKAYSRSNIIYHYFDSVTSNIQKWTAEMWAQLWTFVEHGVEITMPKELDFCWCTDPLYRWDETKILHNSGVTKDDGELFFKGKYHDHTPFDEDLSWVNPEKCSIKYVDAIKKVVI